MIQGRREISAWEQLRSMRPLQGRVSEGIQAKVSQLLSAAVLPSTIPWPENTDLVYYGTDGRSRPRTARRSRLSGLEIGAYDAEFPNHHKELALRWPTSLSIDGTVWAMPMSQASVPSTSLENIFGADESDIVPRVIGTVELHQLVPDEIIAFVVADPRHRLSARLWGTREEYEAARAVALHAYGAQG